MKKIMIINGPNINMLGIREPDIYGTDSLEKIKEICVNKAKELDFELDFFQSNSEGEIITCIQNCFKKYDGIVINPAGYTHTSVAILDALKAVSIPTIEVHISNIFKRESFRNFSYISLYANAVISGCGINGYVLALDGLKNILK